MRSLDATLEHRRTRRALPPPEARRVIRESAGISVRALAREVGVSAMSISRWERSDSNGPGPEHAAAYLAILRRMAAGVLVDA